MKPALPKENVVPWASEHLIPWIFSMIAISASERASAAMVYSATDDLISRLWTKEEIYSNFFEYHSHIY